MAETSAGCKVFERPHNGATRLIGTVKGSFPKLQTGSQDEIIRSQANDTFDPDLGLGVQIRIRVDLDNA